MRGMATDFPITHMLAGPCPRCGMNTVSYNAQSGLAKCESVTVSPMVPTTHYGPISTLMPRDKRTPCGWFGKVEVKAEIEGS